jgi:hypothetical protein
VDEQERRKQVLDENKAAEEEMRAEVRKLRERTAEAERALRVNFVHAQYRLRSRRGGT